MEKSNTIKSFMDLDAWKTGHKLVIMIYEITKKFPREELFGLTNQLRRASVSLTSNIAEGFSRNSYKEKAQFYLMFLGSLTEIQNQIMIARDVGYIDERTTNEVLSHSITVSKIINGLIKKCKSIIHNS